jgi:putative peptide maturation system protein
MNDDINQTVIEALHYLRELLREGAQPGEARERLRQLEARHPGTELDLVWAAEAYDGSIHYDVLLHRAGEGTISLSCCAEEDLPWPLRGVHRSSETDLLRVNDTILSVGQAVGYLEFIWEDVATLKELVNQCLIQEALDKDPVSISDADVQQTMDAFRRAKRLYTAKDTHRWMERRSMTHEMLDDHVRHGARIAKLRERVAAGRVEEYFEVHRTHFETVLVARLEFPSEESARRAGEQIRAGASDFYAEAQTLFQARAERSGPGEAAMFAAVRRREAPAEWQPVFAAAPRDVVGPLHAEKGGHVLVQVLSVRPPHLDEPTRDAAKKALFDEWLAERRRAARIEWHWGDVAQTSQVAKGVP